MTNHQAVKDQIESLRRDATEIQAWINAQGLLPLPVALALKEAVAGYLRDSILLERLLDRAETLGVGARVEHNTYGAGVVVPGAYDGRICVMFDNEPKGQHNPLLVNPEHLTKEEVSQ